MTIYMELYLHQLMKVHSIFSLFSSDFGLLLFELSGSAPEKLVYIEDSHLGDKLGQGGGEGEAESATPPSPSPLWG